ncbi:MAG TPA: hypothetical protein VKA36_03555 [Solirubrobacterales bacterium]|nr:hypothetical protein [Solirubrobacterales bacterium]
MSKIKPSKTSPAMIVAVIALVAALGGGAVAGVAVTSLNKKEKKQVKKLSKRQARKLDKRIELTPGPQGPQGEKGDPGQNAAENIIVRSSGQSSGFREVTCQEGERVIGGGAETGTGGAQALAINAPIVGVGDVATGWRAQANDNAPTAAYVLCASP